MYSSLDALTFLVTGGAGFMGSAFIRHLLKKPTFIGKVINLDALTYSGSLENLKDVEKDSRYSFVEGRVEDKDKVENVFNKYQIDVVVHFAAETHVDRSIYDPEAFLKTNILGTFQLLEAVRVRKTIHFHHISTDEVYGTLSHDGYFDETSTYRPNSPYAASKAASDHLVMSYFKTYGISATISHACNNYGPYQYPEKFIPLATLRLLEKKPIPIYGDGLQIREWMYVEDHAEAILQILQVGRSGEIYNLSSGEEITNIELARRLIRCFAEITGERALEDDQLISYVKDRPGHDFRYAMKDTKMKTELKFQPKVDFTAGLKRTLEWYLKHPEWIEHIRSKELLAWNDKHYAEEKALNV